MPSNALPLSGVAGVDRVTVMPGKTYLRGWAGYGEPPRKGPESEKSPSPAPLAGPPISLQWSKASGPGRVTFADRNAASTTATFSAPGLYRLKLTARNGVATADSLLTVKVEDPAPAQQLQVVHTRRYAVNSPLWNDRFKAMIVDWIPHCVTQLERTDIEVGGIDNFIEAGKALRGEPHGPHRGFVFANAYVYNLVESISLALMIDPQGDREIIDSQNQMRTTLDRWIPIILGAQERDGYLQTAFVLPRERAGGGNPEPGPYQRWERRWDHEGYTAGYFLEAAIVHYMMSDRKDPRLYDAAKRLADCWDANLGPAPKKPWYDGHQEMEQALVRFGRFVNDNDGAGKGDRYIALAKFLLDNRYHSSRSEKERGQYDQCHLPVIEQYEAVGHAVRAMYSYSGMADVVTETHDLDYRSAVKSLWDNIVHRKYYVTGGIGSGETPEGFGGNYSLPNDAYCESCSSCGVMFLQWKMGLAYHDAKYADLLEETMYNALLGGLALDGKTFYYPNALDARVVRDSWHIVPCCVGNIPRTLLQMPTWTYAKDPEGIFVNQFIGSTVLLENVVGNDVEMVQATRYPWDGKVTLTVNPANGPRSMKIRLRVPVRGVSSLYQTQPQLDEVQSLLVNGKRVRSKMVNGYLVIDRRWAAGDRIELELPMPIQRVHADEKIAATRGKVALRYGPLIYNIEKVDVGDITKALAANEPLTLRWREDLLRGVMTINGKFADGSPLLAIPNYARMNREPAAPPGTVTQTTDTDTAKPVVSVVWINENKLA